MKRRKHVRQPSLVAQKKIVICPSNPTANNGEKFSAVFGRFADPLIVGDESLALMESKYNFAMCAWNFALLPADVRLKQLTTFLKPLNKDMRLELKEMLLYMIERKDSLFATYTWKIHSFSLKANGRKFSLTVRVAIPGMFFEEEATAKQYLQIETRET